MTDAEMVEALDDHQYKLDLDWLKPIIERFKQLTLRDAGLPPVTAAREVKLRERGASHWVQRDSQAYPDGPARCYTDLLALLDWERSARLAAENLLCDWEADHNRSSDLPSHQKTWVRMRKLEIVLEKIASPQIGTLWSEHCKMAREALENA